MPRDQDGYAPNKQSHVQPQHILDNLHLALDGYSVARAVRAASKAAKRISTTSHVFDAKREADVPRFSRYEIILGDVLGRGGFSDVFEVKHLKINTKDSAEVNLTDSGRLLRLIGSSGRTLATVGSSEDRSEDESDMETFQAAVRHFTTEHCIRKKTGQARYAIKYLSTSTMKDASSFRIGAADLITESMFLSSLEHPNIIKIRGICDQGVHGFASGLEGGYFILLDRLEETLESRLKTWITREKKMRHFLRGKFTRNTAQKRSQCFTERLNCALDVSAALAYLHSHNIVYRDLKPENIGFDCRGDVKIFDFGLATELHPRKYLHDGLYRLTGETGSLRYMAPEVAKNKPYNLSADVYSFATLLWQLCSLKLPYDGMDKQIHSNMVICGSYRPSIDKSWSFPLRSLMARGWSGDLCSRPTMNSCYKIIRKDIVDLRGGDAAGLEHSKRRSTYVFKAPTKNRNPQNTCKTVSIARTA